MTRLAFGTGTMSGEVQRNLGQDGFTRLVRHAYDNGIRFFETAESYGDMHRMLGIALKGIPRDSYRLMTKVTTHRRCRPAGEDRRAAQAGEYRLLRHYAAALAAHRRPGRRIRCAGRTAFSEAQSKKAVVARGASVHGLPALRQVPGTKWLEIAMIRMNHNGRSMDAEDFDTTGRAM